MNCPLCKAQVYQQIQTQSKVQDTDNFAKAFWFFCKCGCVFTENGLKPQEIFTADYAKTYAEMKEAKARSEYYIYIYGNLVEELTYGRKALDVGYCQDTAIKQLRDRGWMATGIDVVPNTDYHTGDFLDFDFQGNRFDFIKMTDYLQCVEKPLEHLKKAYDLLYPQGVLLLTTPDTDMIKGDIFPAWGHWNAKENRQYYNETILRQMLSKCGKDLNGKFNIILIHRDISRRFPSWNNIHMLLQAEKREQDI